MQDVHATKASQSTTALHEHDYFLQIQQGM